MNQVNRATKYQNLFALHFWVSIRKVDEEEENAIWYVSHWNATGISFFSYNNIIDWKMTLN